MPSINERRPTEPLQPSPALDLADRGAVSAWLVTLRTQVDDALAAGEDATRPLGERDLGRRVARRILLDARDVIRGLLAAADSASASKSD